MKAVLLSKNVTHWISGDTQTSWWNGNGWGYLDYYIGDRAVPSKSTISTNSWEVPSDPQGFYPFESPYLQTAYGAHFARPDKFQYSPDLPDDKHSTSVLIGAIQYGNGKVILDASYWVDYNHALNDMLFYNFIKHGSAVLCYGQPPYKNTSLSIDERVKDLVSRMTIEEKIRQMSNFSDSIPRLGIKEYNYSGEASHGISEAEDAWVVKASSFPQLIAMGSTWNPGLMQEVMDAVASEARAYHNAEGKGLTYWCPTINMLREPRWSHPVSPLL